MALQHDNNAFSISFLSLVDQTSSRSNFNLMD